MSMCIVFIFPIDLEKRIWFNIYNLGSMISDVGWNKINIYALQSNLVIEIYKHHLFHFFFSQCIV